MLEQNLISNKKLCLENSINILCMHLDLSPNSSDLENQYRRSGE